MAKKKSGKKRGNNNAAVLRQVVELPPKEQLKKNEYIISSGKIRKKYASNLEKYLSLGTIDQNQYRAGLRLHQDAVMGGLMAEARGIDYTRFLMPRSAFKEREATEYATDRRKSYREAMYCKDIGRSQREILWHVAILDNDVNSFPGGRDYARVLLRETLTDLANHYKTRNSW